MLCIDDPSAGWIRGHYQSVVQERFSIYLKRCNSKLSDTCRSPEEIDDFIERTMINRYYNTHYFDMNGYENDAKIVRNKLERKTTALIADQATLDSYILQKNRIESEEEYLNLGFSLKELEFYSMTYSPMTQRSKEGANYVFKLNFAMNQDQVIYERSIYTFWDLAGDVGGLFDFLKLVGFQLTTFISFLTGSGIDRFLVSKLFFREQRKLSTSENIQKVVENRKSAKFMTWICLRRSKTEILQ